MKPTFQRLLKRIMIFLRGDKNQHCIHFAKFCVVPELASVMIFVFFCDGKSSFISRNTIPASKYFSYLKSFSKVKMVEQKTFK